MELLKDQSRQNQTEEPEREDTPKKEAEDNKNIYEYDYNKRLWF